MSLYCGNCGVRIEDAAPCNRCGCDPRMMADFCPHCGVGVRCMNPVMCIKCGTVLPRA